MPPRFQAGESCHRAATGLLGLPHEGGGVADENEVSGRVSQPHGTVRNLRGLPQSPKRQGEEGASEMHGVSQEREHLEVARVPGSCGARISAVPIDYLLTRPAIDGVDGPQHVGPHVNPQDNRFINRFIFCLETRQNTRFKAYFDTFMVIKSFHHDHGTGRAEPGRSALG